MNCTVDAAVLTGHPYGKHRAKTSIATLLVHDKKIKVGTSEMKLCLRHKVATVICKTQIASSYIY